MKFAIVLLCFALEYISASNISIDAAFYDQFQNKSYFFQGDRFFSCRHQGGLNFFEQEGSMNRSLPFLPSNLDAAYKIFDKKKSAAFVKDGVRYRTVSLEFHNERAYPDNKEGTDVPPSPDAVAQIGKYTLHFLGKMLWINFKNGSTATKVFHGECQSKLHECPVKMEAALFIGRRLFAVKSGMVWAWDPGEKQHNSLIAGYPQPFRKVFAGGDGAEPHTTTKSAFASKQFIGYTMKEIKVTSLQGCVEICLQTPYFSCSSFNFEVVAKDGKHSCQINRFKAGHFPANFIDKPGFVYHEAHW